MPHNEFFAKAKALFRVSTTYEVKDYYGWHTPVHINPATHKAIYRVFYWEGFDTILNAIIRKTRASTLMGTGALRLFRLNWTERYKQEHARARSSDQLASPSASEIPIGVGRLEDPIQEEAAPITIADLSPDPATERCIEGSNEYFGWFGVDGLNEGPPPIPYDLDFWPPPNFDGDNVVSAPTGIH